MIAALFILALGTAFVLNMPKPADIPSVDLSALPDGQYEGEFDNGIIGASVSVTIRNHQIVAVDLLNHRYGLGQKAEAITDEVISSQSLEVDAISGATLSSNTIIKAIANALVKEIE